MAHNVNRQHRGFQESGEAGRYVGEQEGAPGRLVVRVDYPRKEYPRHQELAGHYPDYIVYELQTDRNRILRQRAELDRVHDEDVQTRMRDHVRIAQLEGLVLQLRSLVRDLRAFQTEQTDIIRRQDGYIARLEHQSTLVMRELSGITSTFGDRFSDLYGDIRAYDRSVQRTMALAPGLDATARELEHLVNDVAGPSGTASAGADSGEAGMVDEEDPEEDPDEDPNEDEMGDV